MKVKDLIKILEKCDLDDEIYDRENYKIESVYMDRSFAKIYIVNKRAIIDTDSLIIKVE